MENLDAILQTLQTVLPTQLLGPSMSALASTLGYSGRNSFYRILKGEAGTDSIQNLLSRLETNLYADLPALQRMEAAITNASNLNRLLKPEFNLDHPDWRFQALRAIIAADYPHFSPGFREGDLQIILNFRRTNTRAFYNMLAWWWLKEKAAGFYRGNKTHHERCAAILEPLGDRLREIFPGNGLALTSAYAYSRSEIYNAEAQTLWSLVESTAVTLEMFASPIGAIGGDNRYPLLPGIPARSYWQGTDSDKALLLWIRPGREAATGHYELFSIDRRSGAIEGIASIYILSDEIASVFTKRDVNTRMSVYAHADDTLTFQWEDPQGDPMQTGNTWKRLSVETSQSLRELDRSLTDDTLIREMARSEGFDYDFSLQATDVVISRERLTLHLKDGSRHSFPIREAPFLKDLTPDEDIMVCRQLSDGRIFVIWPEIRQSIPLDLFQSTPDTPAVLSAQKR